MAIITKNIDKQQKLHSGVEENVMHGDTLVRQLEKLMRHTAQAAFRKDHEQAMSVLVYEQHIWKKFGKSSATRKERAYAEGIKYAVEEMLQFVLDRTAPSLANNMIAKHKEALPILQVLGKNARAGTLFAVSSHSEDAHASNNDSDVLFESSSMDLAELVEATGVKLRRLVDVVKYLGRYDLVKIGSKDGALRVVITNEGKQMLDSFIPGWQKMEPEQVRIIAERPKP